MKDLAMFERERPDYMLKFPTRIKENAYKTVGRIYILNIRL